MSKCYVGSKYVIYNRYHVEVEGASTKLGSPDLLILIGGNDKFRLVNLWVGCWNGHETQRECFVSDAIDFGL